MATPEAYRSLCRIDYCHCGDAKKLAYIRFYEDGTGAVSWTRSMEDFTGRGYTLTPSDHPVFLYQDIIVALKEELRINNNNGQTTLHALCLPR